MYVSIEVKFGVLCRDCNVRNPFVGLRTAGSCYNCGEPMNIREIFEDACDAGIREMFGGAYDIVSDAVALRKEGEPCTSSESSVRTFDCRRKLPYCPRCGAEVPLAGILAGGGMFRCGVCREGIPVRCRDATTMQWDERIDLVVNDRGGGADLSGPTSSEAKAFHCQGCGAALSADGSRRLVTCGYCGSSSKLPDNLWRTLHPAPRMEPFFLLYQDTPLLRAAARARVISMSRAWQGGGGLLGEMLGEVPLGEKMVPIEHQYRRDLADLLSPEHDHLVRRALGRPIDATLFASLLKAGAVRQEELAGVVKRAGTRIRRIVAAAPGAPAAVMATLARDQDERVRMTAACNPGLPTSVMERLAEDPVTEVRARVAGNLGLPADIMPVLASDPEEAVRRVVAHHPSATPAVLSSLAKDDDRHIRRQVAQNPGTPFEVLRKLARDDDSDVARSAREHSAYRNAGFFSKLFG
jgi:hypothetical protein